MGVIQQFLLSKGPHRHHITETTQHSRRVFKGFAPAQLGHLRIEIHRLPAKACHRDLKAHSCARRCLGKNQSENSISQINATIPALELTGKLKQGNRLLRSEISAGKKVSTLEVSKDGCNTLGIDSH
ncbi:MAG: Uncharacterised protein [Prochlorococcus marinus str. MIT 9313]|nr:MAG: Uncharacterised protein [Prochlorococcus marinus str. MIT 9313]